MTTIYNKLAITPEEYESMIWHLYSNWCISITTTDKEFQQVVANSSINTWFRMELTNCEADFIKRTSIYTNPNVTPKDFEQCYKDCTYSLFNIRPMALLAGIVKQKTKGIPAFSALTQN